MAKPKRRQVVCHGCGDLRPNHGKGYCRPCYYEAHKEARKEYQSKYRKANPEVILAQKHRHRERQYKNGGTFTGKEWVEVKKKYPHCPSCGRKFGLLNRATIDHVFPLQGGGRNDIGNIQPLCGRCNKKKGTKSTDYRR